MFKVNKSIKTEFSKSLVEVNNFKSPKTNPKRSIICNVLSKLKNGVAEL